MNNLLPGFDDARDALNGYLFDALLEAGEAGVDLSDGLLLALDQLLQDLLLLAHHCGEFSVHDALVQLAT